MASSARRVHCTQSLKHKGILALEGSKRCKVGMQGLAVQEAAAVAMVAKVAVRAVERVAAAATRGRILHGPPKGT